MLVGVRAGKSTLVNALAQQEACIVDSTPGTTADVKTVRAACCTLYSSSLTTAIKKIHRSSLPICVHSTTTLTK